MRKMIVFLIVLIGLVVVIDRVVLAGTQNYLANKIESTGRLESTPTVSIEGIPFLTQAFAGRYPTVNVDLGTVNVNGVPIKDVTATAFDVTAPLADVIQNRADVRAERLVVRGTLTNATVDKYAPRGIKISANGDRLVASGEVAVGAQRVKMTAEMRVDVVDGGIKLVATKIQGVPDALAGFVTYTIPFKGKLPFNAKVTAVKTVPAGLEVTAEGSDVPLNGRT